MLKVLDNVLLVYSGAMESERECGLGCSACTEAFGRTPCDECSFLWNILNLILNYYSKIVPENGKLVWTIGKKWTIIWFIICSYTISGRKKGIRSYERNRKEV